MLPEGWKLKRIHEVGRVVTGTTPPSSNAALYLGQVPFVTPGDLGSLRNISTAERALSAAGMGYARPVPAGSTLVTCIGSTIGKLGFATVPVATNQQINAVVPHSEHDPDFIYYQLERLGPSFKILAGTQAVPLLNKSTFSEVQLGVPATRQEESRIAEVLVTWDAATTATEKLLANARTVKKALAGRLLGAHRHWRSLGFDELFKVINRKETQVVASEYLPQGRMPIIDQGQRFIAGYTEDDSVYVDPPMIVFGDHTRAVKWVDFRFRLGADGTQLLSPKPSIHPKLAYHLLANAAIPNLGYSRHMSVLKQLRFSIPPDEDEQIAIATRLDTADKAIASIEAQARYLVKEKRALMQDLLTGKRRVKLPSTDTVATPP